MDSTSEIAQYCNNHQICVNRKRPLPTARKWNRLGCEMTHRHERLTNLFTRALGGQGTELLAPFFAQCLDQLSNTAHPPNLRHLSNSHHALSPPVP